MTNNVPKGYLTDSKNLWIKQEGEIVSLGVLENAAKSVKEFVFIQLPKNNIEIKKGDELVSLEAVKWSGHLTSPVSGKIIEVNESLFDEPSKINEKPYEAWIVKIKFSNKKELEVLK